MVYNTSEHHNLGQLRAELLAREENSVNHLNDRYYKVKSQSGEGKYNVTFIEEICKCNYRIQLQGY
jgi:hypothetical protein